MTVSLFRATGAGAFTMAEINARLAAGTWPRNAGDETSFRARHFTYRLPLNIRSPYGGPGWATCRAAIVPFRRPGTNEIWLFVYDLSHVTNGTTTPGGMAGPSLVKMSYDAATDVWTVTRRNLTDFLYSNSVVMRDFYRGRAFDVGSGVVVTFTAYAYSWTTGAAMDIASHAFYIAYADSNYTLHLPGPVTAGHRRGWYYPGREYQFLDRGMDGAATYPGTDFRWTAYKDSDAGNTVVVRSNIYDGDVLWNTANGRAWDPAGYSFGSVHSNSGVPTCFTLSHQITGSKDRHLWFYVDTSGNLRCTLFVWNITNTGTNTTNSWTQRFDTVIDSLGGGAGAWDLRGIMRVSDDYYVFNYRGHLSYVKLNLTWSAESVLNSGRLSPTAGGANDKCGFWDTPVMPIDASRYWYMTQIAGTWQLRRMTLASGALADDGVGYDSTIGPGADYRPQFGSSTGDHVLWYGWADPANAKGIRFSLGSALDGSALFLRHGSLINGVVGWDSIDHLLAIDSGFDGTQQVNAVSSTQLLHALQFGNLKAFMAIHGGNVTCVSLYPPAN
jgi:hypothetical protein